jgi:hypothetical protein
MLQDFEDRWQDPQKRILLLETLRWIEEEPSLLGATQHLIAIATKNRKTRNHHSQG